MTDFKNKTAGNSRGAKRGAGKTANVGQLAAPMHKSLIVDFAPAHKSIDLFVESGQKVTYAGARSALPPVKPTGKGKAARTV